MVDLVVSHSEDSEFGPPVEDKTYEERACGSESILSCRSHLPTVTDMDHPITGGNRICPMGASVSEIDLVSLPGWAEDGKVRWTIHWGTRQTPTKIFWYNDWGKSNFWLCSVRYQYIDVTWKDINVKSWYISGTKNHIKKIPLSSGSTCVSTTISYAGMRYRIVEGIYFKVGVSVDKVSIYSWW
jgi:hypothetical protein